MVKQLLTLLVVLHAFALKAQTVDASYVQQHYTKTSYNIPMRDGIKLYTLVYTPKDTPPKPIPFYSTVLVITPHSAMTIFKPMTSRLIIW